MPVTDLLRRIVPLPVKILAKRMLGMVPAHPGSPMPRLIPPRRTAIDLSDTAAIRAFVVRSNERGGPDATATQAWWETLRFDVPPRLRAAARRTRSGVTRVPGAAGRGYAAIVGNPYQETTSELTGFDKEAAAAGHLAYPELGAAGS